MCKYSSSAPFVSLYLCNLPSQVVSIVGASTKMFYSSCYVIHGSKILLLFVSSLILPVFFILKHIFQTSGILPVSPQLALSCLQSIVYLHDSSFSNSNLPGLYVGCTQSLSTTPYSQNRILFYLSCSVKVITGELISMFGTYTMIRA